MEISVKDVVILLITMLLGFFSKWLYDYIKKKNKAAAKRELTNRAKKLSEDNYYKLMDEITSSIMNHLKELELLEKQSDDWGKKMLDNEISPSEFDVKSKDLKRRMKMLVNEHKKKIEKIKTRYPLNLDENIKGLTKELY